jgi:hypothetical protein
VKLKYVLLHQKKGTHNYLEIYESTKKKSMADLHFASFENLSHFVSWYNSNGEFGNPSFVFRKCSNQVGVIQGSHT